MDLTKAEIIQRGVQLGVDYGKTHSCYDPDPQGLACGTCDSCVLRRRGFEAAGVPDPTRYSVTTTLPISETFDSIQGEGSLLGTPSFFIRTAGCNLRCTWCDTPYASWDAAGDQRSVASLVEEVQQSGRRHVVLTGGEPLMFPGLVELNDAPREAGCHVTVETAGTLLLPLTCDLLSCSPKLSNSTPTNDPRDPSGQWAERHEAALASGNPVQIDPTVRSNPVEICGFKPTRLGRN